MKLWKRTSFRLLHSRLLYISPFQWLFQIHRISLLFLDLLSLSLPLLLPFFRYACKEFLYASSPHRKKAGYWLLPEWKLPCIQKDFLHLWHLTAFQIWKAAPYFLVFGLSFRPLYGSVHMDSLLSMQFSYELLILSYKHRLYLHLQHYLLRATRFRELSPTPLERDSRWTFSCSELGCRLSIYTGT